MFAMGWLLMAIYLFGIENKEKEMLSQIFKKLILKKNIYNE